MAAGPRKNGYRNITATLAGRIRSGAYAPGTALPPRLELMAEFGVARATIDRCIGELRQQGMVTARHGSGTYVQKHLSRTYRIGVVGSLIAEERLPAEWSVEHYHAEELRHRSDWRKLLDHDGLLWVRPEEPLAEVMAWTRERLPQVAVNRVIAGEYCVSTDHRGAYRAIAAERLAQLPESPLFLLTPDHTSLPCEYRAAGVIDACREARRFYEILPMPDRFAAKLAMLQERLPQDPGQPLLLISTTLANTGAVMDYAKERRWQWRKDLFYSDFDNAYPEDVWGVAVTSFQQDHSALLTKAAEILQERLEGREPESKLYLHSPLRRNGDT